jgi:hypothetical protein
VQTTYALLEPFSYNRGYRKLISPASPAAGATYTHTVPGDAWERLLAITFLLTTSATVADRLVTIDYAPKGGNTFLSDGAAVTVSASTTNQAFNGSSERGQSEWNTGTSVFFPLWGGFLEAGWTFKINVGAIDTTDQLSGINFMVEKFEVGHEGYLVGGLDTADYAEWRAEHFLP